MKEYKPSAAYKQAKETFKSLKKSGGKRPTDVLSPPPLVTVAASSGQVSLALLHMAQACTPHDHSPPAQTPSSLEEQNSKLRALVQEQAARIDVQAKAIDALQQGLPLPAEAAAIVSLVTSHPAASASAPSDLTTEPPAEPVGSIAAKPSTAPSAVGPEVSLARGSLPHPTASDAARILRTGSCWRTTERRVTLLRVDSKGTGREWREGESCHEENLNGTGCWSTRGNVKEEICGGT